MDIEKRNYLDGARVGSLGRPTIDSAAAAYLDLLRAAAANMVVFAHYFLQYSTSQRTYPLGSTGVVIFFLLSGFLIAQSMVNKSATASGRFPAFLADRVGRIMTPYLPALLFIAIVDAVLAIPKIGQPGLSSGTVALLGNAFMFQDYPVFQLIDPTGSGLPWRIRAYNSAEPFWTVSIEFWIYVAVGLMFFVFIGAEKLKPIILFALVAISFPVFMWNAAGGAGQSLSLIWLAGAAGGLLSIWFSRMSISKKRVRLIAFTLTGLAIVATIAHVRKYSYNPYNFQTAFLVGVCLFGPVLWLQTVHSQWRFFSNVTGRLASYSYSLYLTHNTSIAVIYLLVSDKPTPQTLLAAVALSHISGLCLWWVFERHHRKVSLYFRPKFEAWMSGGFSQRGRRKELSVYVDR